MLKRHLFVTALLMSVAFTPARADDISSRVDQMEEQIRQLTGQIEQLNFQLKQVQAQNLKKLGALETNPPPSSEQANVLPVAPVAVPKLAVQSAALAPKPVKKPVQPAPDATASGVETIDEQPVLPQAQPLGAGPVAAAAAETQVAGVASAPRPLGLGTKTASQPNDGGYQGKVLVAPGGDETVAAGDDVPATAQQVSLQPETPDDLFLRSEKALLQLQYADAESGFKDFITKYPDHNLAGSAQFKLGETYWAEQNYSSSAQAYMNSYKKYPKGRRAPDSLLKLGLSLARLGQKDQACATIGSVDSEFPNAVEIKKRAQAEFKREGC